MNTPENKIRSTNRSSHRQRNNGSESPGVSVAHGHSPLAAASVILGLSMLTVSHLKAEHFWLGWLPYFRITLLSAGCLGSLWLALGLVRQATVGFLKSALAFIAMLLPAGLMATIWTLVFFVW